MKTLTAVLLGTALLALPVTADARDLWTSEDFERSIRLDSALKSSWLLSYAPKDKLLFPERTSGAMLMRLRLGPRAEPWSWMHVGFAYEHRSRLESGAGGLGAGATVLPAESAPFYRIWPGDWSLIDIEPGFTHRHEIDRAFIAFKHPVGEITIGRQALGWGRGVLFSAVDIFAPFSPLEVDREWRRGIDAFRADIELHEQLSVEVVVALGDKLDTDESVFAGRLRGYVGDFDGEIIFGRRGRDWMYATTLSARIGEAEIHGELALFDTPGEAPSGEGLFGSDDLVLKAVVGASYNIDWGNGIPVFVEYHYSGFGLKKIEDVPLLLFDASLQNRFLRGDSQLLTRHALAITAGYEISMLFSLSLLWMQNPVDGSGMFSAGLTWNFADNVTLLANAFLPYGKGPENGVLRSEYGSSPITGFIQLRLYD